MVKNAVVSAYSPSLSLSEEEWKQQIKASEIRVQWDSEGNITDYVTQLREKKDLGMDVTELLPNEKIYNI